MSLMFTGTTHDGGSIFHVPATETVVLPLLEEADGTIGVVVQAWPYLQLPNE